MKKTILRLILLSTLSSCSIPKQENTQISIVEENSPVTADSLERESIQRNTSETTETAGCIFDQATQTDDFLEGVKELKGYTWDYSSRRATYILETGDTLLITRGGCDHFTVSAEFRLRKNRIDYSDWNNVYVKVLWIAKILDDEFHHEELKKDIDSGKATIEDGGYADVASFENETLVDNGYAIERILHPDRTMIKLSKTIN